MFNILEHTTLKFVLIPSAHKSPIIGMAPFSCSRDETAGYTANQSLSVEASFPTCREHAWILMTWQLNSSTAVLPRGTEDDSLSTHRYLLVPCNGSLIRYTTPIPPSPLRSTLSQGQKICSTRNCSE
jgi:hypothetical protein